MAEPESTEVPVAALFEGVVGQPTAVAQLRASARRPVHAYLLHGPPGSGKRAAARGFAAALLCPQGGCGTCSTCRRALAGTHPDLVVVDSIQKTVRASGRVKAISTLVNSTLLMWRRKNPLAGMLPNMSGSGQGLSRIDSGGWNAAISLVPPPMLSK